MCRNDEEVNRDVKLKQLQHNLRGEKEREREGDKDRERLLCYFGSNYYDIKLRCENYLTELKYRMFYKIRSRNIYNSS